ncbi:MAG: ATP-dependent helicase HrpB [Desulfuromonadales bacterium]|nr:ATP-dependent helicase HrpB [Desulfuromonadales bacterium]
MILPIHGILDELKDTLAAHPAVILQAPPGAGKTTQVPLALLDEKWLMGKRILMLEPRRLAAVNAARYMAELRHEKVGQTVGFRIRYHHEVSRQTRIEVVTEGILTRRLQSDPELAGVGLVIFDEFHERNLNSDLALALCRDIQTGLREDLKILVMSATLDGAQLAERLDAPILTSKGRSFPVTVHHTGAPENSPAEATVTAVRKALQETGGDILAFLPGAGEINRCQEQLREIKGVDILPLYGSLTYKDQEAAIRPGKRRKVVLATNIAETSLTIEGVSVVIDSGYARQPRFDPGSGLTRLELVRISRASAEQRSGRAGRVGPGACYRLWSAGAHGSLLPFTPPEIRNADLAPLALELANWGISEPQALTWLDPPPAANLEAGRQLLKLLGALDDNLRLTPEGKRLVQIPAHPRLGRMLLVAQQLGCLPLACDLVGLLSEPSGRGGHGNDLQSQIEGLWNARRQGGGKEFAKTEQAVSYWRAFHNLPSVEKHPENELSQFGTLLASAFPDRIGRLREGEKNRYLFTSGQGGYLSEHSPLERQNFLVASEIITRRDENQIIQATPLSLDEILALYPECPWQKEVFWHSREGRVVARSVRCLGKLNLSDQPLSLSADETTRVILNAVRSEGLDLLNWTPQVETFMARARLAKKAAPNETWPELSRPKLLENIDNWLLPHLGRARNSKDLKNIDLLNALQSLFDWQQLKRLERLAPERVRVASGSNIRLQYGPEDSPVLAVKLQEMFGEADTPRIAEGRVTVQLHLLSPAGRPLQVTRDLRSFWNEVYPEVKKEMKGRYPRHPWPDDPWNAAATRHTKKQISR